jgi:hypothetical protein
MIRLRVIVSPTNWVASSPAAIGLTVIVFATRVGVALSRANQNERERAAAYAEIDAGQPLWDPKSVQDGDTARHVRFGS